jgi:hypothetical protein
LIKKRSLGFILGFFVCLGFAAYAKLSEEPQED